MKYQVIAKVESFGHIESLHHYEGESLEAAMEDYQMDMSQVNRGRIDRVELVADGALIRYMDKGGEDTEVSQEVKEVSEMKYEQGSFESLPNRAGHVERFMGKAETPEQAFCVLYQLPNGGWWNGQECQSAEDAERIMGEWKSNNSPKAYKIVVAHK